MDIDRDGREWAHWDLVAAPDGDLEVTFVSHTWHPLTRDGDTVRVLVAGPGALDNPGGTVVLTKLWNRAWIRSVASPEILVRSARSIRVW